MVLFLCHPCLSLAEKKEETEINFEMTAAIACTKQKAAESCLYQIFGKGIGFTTKDNSLTSVNFPQIRNRDIKVNGTVIKSVVNPSIHFFPKEGTYSICGTSNATAIANLQLIGNGRCLCGFSPKGEFSRRLEENYAFIQEKTKILAKGVGCREKGLFDAGLVTILEKAKICGYDFPKDTEFYILESYPAFVAPKNGVIDGKGGNQISVVKGKKYMSDSSAEKPCNWEPVPEDVEDE